jgi:predicted dehydrogenase
MPEKVKWGVLGVAKIATTKVIPAMQAGEWTEVAAIASRDTEKARVAARKLGIPKAYGSYEELLADPEIAAIYNPLPNHLHVPWSIRAARAGKHVLCEKPVGLNAAECRTLIEARRSTGVQIGEAFMVRSHPQWLRAREIARTGAIGDVRAITAAFSYFNRDPSNVRNVAGWGGGALMDIGCYPIQVARFLLGQEPLRVLGLIHRDPDFHTDRLTSAVLEFPSTHCVFTCGTQMAPYQRVVILGATGRIEIEIPFNAPPDRPTRIYADPAGWEEFPVCDQYTLQGDEFSRAVLGLGPVPTPLEDSLRNMAVIDALFESARTCAWMEPEVD